MPLSFELSHPTPYSKINSLLQELLSTVHAILGDRFVGMYLFGSLAGGDFDPQNSDIDFLVVTDGDLPGETVAALGDLHGHLATSRGKWGARLEGSYIPREVLNRTDLLDSPRPSTNEGRFYLGVRGSDWILQRHIVRESGVVLAGPEPKELFDPLGADDLRRATQGVLDEWWGPMLDDPVRLRNSEYQAYAVLTMCRMLYSLEHGTLVSKPVAAHWALDKLDEHWRGLIQRALIQHANTQRFDVPEADLSDTLDFIHYTIERSRWGLT